MCINTSTNTHTTKEAKTSYNNTTPRDAKGKVLKVGQQVKFVTKGKYHSTEGTVETIKPTRVISVDNNKNKIVRSHKNVEVISKHVKRDK